MTHSATIRQGDSLTALRDALGPNCLKPRQTIADLSFPLFRRMLCSRWRIRDALRMEPEWIEGRDETEAAIEDFETRAADFLAIPHLTDLRKAELMAVQTALDAIRQEIGQ